jgi:hypothetical protein
MTPAEQSPELNELLRILEAIDGLLEVYVRIPAGIDPEDRFTRFHEPLDSALQWIGGGSVTGGGTMYSAGPDEEREVLYCGIDVDLANAAKTFPLFLDELRYLEVPKGTTVEFAVDGADYVIDVWPEESRVDG